MRHVERLTPELARRFLPARDLHSRKGENGRVLVVGGSREYFGSPALAGLAAMRAGADLCYFVVPRFIAPVVAGYAPDLIVWSYEGEYLNKKCLPLLEGMEKRVDALVIGNGLTKSPAVLSLAREIIGSWPKALVVDADALMPKMEFASKKVVLTPHAAEFDRIGAGKPRRVFKERAEQVSRFAESIGATVLLKGVEDIASNGARTIVSSTGNPGMTSGGTGDTLAGICATFLSQGLKPVEAAALAAFVNGAAGDRAFKRLGFSLLASDLISELPFTLKELQGQR